MIDGLIISMNDKNLDHDRWWIDKKLDDINRFEQRQLQIISLLSIIITLLAIQISSSDMTTLPDTTVFVKTILGILILLTAVGLIVIYLYFSWPRKADKPLDASFRMEPTRKAYGDYIAILQKSLKKKAKLMPVSYVLFSLEIVLVILLVLTG